MDTADDLLRIVVGANALTRIASMETRNEAPAAQWRTLSLLRTHGPQRVGDLASLSRVTQPGMTRLVGQLADDGLVARSSDPADSRAIVVSITDAGARALEGWLGVLRSSWEPRLADLDDADRAALARTADLLERVATLPGVIR
ncbi:MarR family transcriptional regulator [Microbacterium sp.]|uniref:MarR family transcriptional regulator n=1 Tax=Microbacterium sp. TaxID=51671 RepID=UPI0039E2B047